MHMGSAAGAAGGVGQCFNCTIHARWSLLPPASEANVIDAGNVHLRVVPQGPAVAAVQLVCAQVWRLARGDAAVWVLAEETGL